MPEIQLSRGFYAIVVCLPNSTRCYKCTMTNQPFIRAQTSRKPGGWGRWHSASLMKNYFTSTWRLGNLPIHLWLQLVRALKRSIRSGNRILHSSGSQMMWWWRHGRESSANNWIRHQPSVVPYGISSSPPGLRVLIGSR